MALGGNILSGVDLAALGQTGLSQFDVGEPSADKGLFGNITGLQAANMLTLLARLADPEGQSPKTLQGALKGPNLVALLNQLKAKQSQAGIRKSALGTFPAGRPGRDLESMGTQGDLLRPPGRDERVSPNRGILTNDNLDDIMRTFTP